MRESEKVKFDNGNKCLSISILAFEDPTEPIPFHASFASSLKFLVFQTDLFSLY